jgi:hypothetical protein
VAIPSQRGILGRDSGRGAPAQHRHGFRPERQGVCSIQGTQTSHQRAAGFRLLPAAEMRGAADETGGCLRRDTRHAQRHRSFAIRPLLVIPHFFPSTHTSLKHKRLQLGPLEFHLLDNASSRPSALLLLACPRRVIAAADQTMQSLAAALRAHSCPSSRSIRSSRSSSSSRRSNSNSSSSSRSSSSDASARTREVQSSLEFARMCLCPAPELGEIRRIKLLMAQLQAATQASRRESRAGPKAMARCLLRWKLGAVNTRKTLPKWVGLVSHWLNLLANFRHGKRAMSLVQGLQPHDRALLSVMGAAVAKFRCLRDLPGITRFDVTHLGMCVTLLEAAESQLGDGGISRAAVENVGALVESSGLSSTSSSEEMETLIASVNPMTIAAWFLGDFGGERISVFPAESVGLCVALSADDSRCMHLRGRSGALCPKHRSLSSLSFGSCEEVSSPLPLSRVAHFARKTKLGIQLHCFHNVRPVDLRSEFGGELPVLRRFLGIDKKARPVLALSRAVKRRRPN